jgi:hypothetical protein
MSEGSPNQESYFTKNAEAFERVKEWSRQARSKLRELEGSLNSFQGEPTAEEAEKTLKIREMIEQMRKDLEFYVEKADSN